MRQPANKEGNFQTTVKRNVSPNMASSTLGAKKGKKKIIKRPNIGKEEVLPQNTTSVVSNKKTLPDPKVVNKIAKHDPAKPVVISNKVSNTKPTVHAKQIERQQMAEQKAEIQNYIADEIWANGSLTPEDRAEVFLELSSTTAYSTEKIATFVSEYEHSKIAYKINKIVTQLKNSPAEEILKMGEQVNEDGLHIFSEIHTTKTFDLEKKLQAMLEFIDVYRTPEIKNKIPNQILTNWERTFYGFIMGVMQGGHYNLIVKYINERQVGVEEPQPIVENDHPIEKVQFPDGQQVSENVEQ